MKKAFSLLEVIISISIISILIYAFVPKYINIFSYASKSTAKIQYAMITQGILDVKTKSILKGKTMFLNLDNASINIENEALFSNVLKEPILSQKDTWMKISENEYFLNIENKKIYFEYKNGYFICKDTNNICKELE